LHSARAHRNRCRLSFPSRAAAYTTAVLTLNVKERGVGNWIYGPDLSAGMVRAFSMIAALNLAEPGSVVLIDEIENSLGKNCMPALVDLLLSRAPDLQFIITSHHPYIINNIPLSAWKLVRREGSRVRVVHARDIPELQEASHHEAFDRLMNLPEFEEGMT
jgi:predicted ATPase